MVRLGESDDRLSTGSAACHFQRGFHGFATGGPAQNHPSTAKQSGKPFGHLDTPSVRAPRRGEGHRTGLPSNRIEHTWVVPTGVYDIPTRCHVDHFAAVDVAEN